MEIVTTRKRKIQNGNGSSNKKGSGGRRMVKAVRRMQNPVATQPMSTAGEIKAVDIPSQLTTFVTVAVPPTMQLLNPVLSGAGFFNRIGAKLNMKSLRVRGFIQNISTCVQDAGRIIIFYDRQTNGAAPSIDTLLQTRNNAGTASTTGLSEINLDNRDRFVILRDKHIILPSCTNEAGVLTNYAPQITTQGDKSEFIFDEFIKLKGLQTMYSASTGLVGDIRTGGLFMVLVCENSTANYQMRWSARLRYFDN